MSRQLVKEHAARLARPGAQVRCIDEGETVIVVIEPFAPARSEAYKPSSLEALAFLVPVTYPDAEPDPTGFYVKPAGIRLVDGDRSPNSATPTPLLGDQWMKFSWKRKTFQWDPNVDTLETHLATIENRFRRGD